MRALASFIMRGRMQAVLVSVLFAGLSLILPPLMYLSGGAVALVTLRLGGQQGLSVALFSGMAITLIALLGIGTVWPGVILLLIVWLPVWGLAVILRQTISLGFAFGVASLVAATLVLAGYLIVPDPTLWWQGALDEVLGPILEQAGVSQQPGMQEVIPQIAKLMTGVVAVAIVINVMCSLLLGRWWQAVLYNPGGFREEFHELRLPKTLAMLTVLAMAASYLVSGAPGVFAGNLVIVFASFYFMQGLAICHAVVARKGMHIAWLIGMYVLVLFLPQLMLMLTLLGLVDAVADFRRRLAGAPKQDRHDDSA